MSVANLVRIYLAANNDNDKGYDTRNRVFEDLRALGHDVVLSSYIDDIEFVVVMN